MRRTVSNQEISEAALAAFYYGQLTAQTTHNCVLKEGYSRCVIGAVMTKEEIEASYFYSLTVSELITDNIINFKDVIWANWAQELHDNWARGRATEAQFLAFIRKPRS